MSFKEDVDEFVKIAWHLRTHDDYARVTRHTQIKHIVYATRNHRLAGWENSVLVFCRTIQPEEPISGDVRMAIIHLRSLTATAAELAHGNKEQNKAIMAVASDMRSEEGKRHRRVLCDWIGAVRDADRHFASPAEGTVFVGFIDTPK